MEKTFQPQNIEAHWSRFWEEKGYGQAAGEGQPYSIVIPPPNVTGSLHMGHGFQLTLMDILIRHHKLRGYNTLWQVGTDHAGIATQMVVERQLAQEGTNKETIGKAAFLEKIWQWKKTSGGMITEQMRRLGILVDWQDERFTMDEGLSQAVRKVFVALYQQGLIYRGKRLVNWDNQLQTAISDLEIISQERQGKLWHIRYPLVSDPSQSLTIATTRPETLFADVAIAVNPDDPRYQSFIGQKVQVPLCERQIPIIADDSVEIDFGSGCLKVTPAHDFNDWAIGQRHQLPHIELLHADGRLNDNAPEALRGLDVSTARQRTVEWLEAAKLLLDSQDHQQQVPIGDRSGTIIEPRLTEQWFVNTQALAEKALEAARDADIRFYPSEWVNTYARWLENIDDWCISRQIWWGHRIPCWCDPEGNLYVADDEASARKNHQLADDLPLKQDEDVLDTWFSSALWPFSSMGWPEDNKRLKTFYPTRVLVTGFDIIFFWVARMVMMGQTFMQTVPFKDIYITGLIRDFRGEKMSKSKGNVINPIDIVDGISLDDLIAQRTDHLMQPHLKNQIILATKKEFPQGIAAHGTDALRLTFAAMATSARDIRFDMDRLSGYRNFCNKVWNATRFILQQETSAKDHGLKLTISQWLENRLVRTEKAMQEAIDAYRFDHYTLSLYHGFWHDFCDNYLEMAKIMHLDFCNEQQEQLQHDLLRFLKQYLVLLHPLAPFLSEALFQSIQSDKASLLDHGYQATVNDDSRDNTIADTLSWVSQVRTLRSELGLDPRLVIKAQWQGNGPQLQTQLLTGLAKIQLSQQPLSETGRLPCNHQGFTLLLAIGEHLDPEKDKVRLQKNHDKMCKEQKALDARLQNDSYMAKAPKERIAKDREQLADLNERLAKSTATLKELGYC